MSGILTALRLAEKQGLDTSDSTYLDASNLDYEKKVNKFKANIMLILTQTGDLTRDEAHKLFRYSDQTWLPHNLDKTMKRIYSRALKMVQVHPSMVDVEQLQVSEVLHLEVVLPLPRLSSTGHGVTMSAITTVSVM